MTDEEFNALRKRVENLEKFRNIKIMEWQHVYPVNDKKEHKLEGLDCDCEPTIDLDNQIVIHNAYDMREAQEFINKTP